MIRKHATILGCALLLTLTFAGTQAKADRVTFRFTGGSWSHAAHRGWHHYWGGPSVGFYYAPEPVYIVDGYDDPTYYTGPDFWYSNPSFGFGITLGGGGGGYRYGDRDRADFRYRGDYGRGDREVGGYRLTERGHSDAYDRGSRDFHGDRGSIGRDGGVESHGDRGSGGHSGGSSDFRGDRGSSGGSSFRGSSHDFSRGDSGSGSRSYSGSDRGGSGRGSVSGDRGGSSHSSGGDRGSSGRSSGGDRGGHDRG